jgi:hypothetical protein
MSDVIVSDRKCLGCGDELTEKTAYRSSSGRLQSRCRICMVYDARDRRGSRKMGDLSAREYDDLMDRCRGRCGLCGRGGNRALCYKELYGIYCDWCTGAIEGGPDLLNKALAYVGGGVEPAPEVW